MIRFIITILILISSAHASKLSSEHYISQLIQSMGSKNFELIKVQKGSKLSIKIDDSVIKILSTKTGSEICKAFPKSKNFSLSNALLVNSDKENTLFELCNKKLWVGNSTLLNNKSYFIVIVPDQTSLVIRGWTTEANETILFFQQSEFNDIDKYLISILAHELAISYDAKSAIGQYGYLDFANLGIDAGDENDFLTRIVRQTEVKNTLAAVRATMFELKVVKELGQKISENQSKFLELSCDKRMLITQPLVTKMDELYYPQWMINDLLDAPTKDTREFDYANFSDLVFHLNYIKIKIVHTGRMLSACEYLAGDEPFVTAISGGTGPGPRIGGGWDRMDAFSDCYNKLHPSQFTSKEVQECLQNP